MTLERTVDATRVNRMLEACDGARLAPHLAESRDNFCLIDDGGVAIFLKLCPGLYEMHAAVLPPYRGAWTRQSGQKCLEIMFVDTDALEIAMRPFAGNVAAIAGCRMLGAHREFTTLGGQHVYVLTLCGFLGFMFGDDPAAYARFAAVCPRKGNAAFRRFWSLSGRTEPCPLQPLPPLS